MAEKVNRCIVTGILISSLCVEWWERSGYVGSDGDQIDELVGSYKSGLNTGSRDSIQMPHLFSPEHPEKTRPPYHEDDEVKLYIYRPFLCLHHVASRTTAPLITSFSSCIKNVFIVCFWMQKCKAHKLEKGNKIKILHSVLRKKALSVLREGL